MFSTALDTGDVFYLWCHFSHKSIHFTRPIGQHVDWPVRSCLQISRAIHWDAILRIGYSGCVSILLFCVVVLFNDTVDTRLIWFIDTSVECSVRQPINRQANLSVMTPISGTVLWICNYTFVCCLQNMYMIILF